MKKDKFVPQFTNEQLLDIFEGFLDMVEEYSMYDAYDFLPEVIRFITLYETDTWSLKNYTYKNFFLPEPLVDLSPDKRDR